jgi:hypothetical protein
MTLIPAIAFFLIIKPYAQSIYNTVDAIILLSFVLFCIGASAISLSNFNIKYRPFSCAMTGIGLSYPATYASVLVTYKMLPKCAILSLKRCFKKFTSVNHDLCEDALLEVGAVNDHESDAFLLDRD